MAVSAQQGGAHDGENGVDVSLLKDLAKKSLVDALNSVSGAKTLILDPSMAGPLGLVTEVSLLKQHGVDKMYWLEQGPLSSVSTTAIVYLCRPKIRHVKIIADQIKAHLRGSQKYTYTLLLVPRVSVLVERILEEEGVLGEVSISSYNLQFIPLAEDVVSLELENAFKEIWVDGDETAVYDSAKALVTLQKLYGLFPRIVGKGDRAARLTKLVTQELSTDDSASSVPTGLSTQSEQVDAVIVLDRAVDMITPLLTQLTYEGLVDELIGIKNGYVQLPASLVSPPSNSAANAPAASTSTAVQTTPLSKEAKKKYQLNAKTDPLFGELRDVNFSAVGKRLNKVARRLEEDYQARKQAKTVTQLRDFVGKLGGLQTERQSLEIHTGLSELLIPLTRTQQFNRSLEIQQNLLASYDVNGQINAIEDLIAQGADMQTVLRLLCLASITAGGIKAKTLENIKREFLQAYGYNLLPLLLSLASPSLAMLLPNPLPPTLAGTKYPYTTLRKSLRLMNDDPDAPEELENDISYVYSGFAPISVRLVQCVAQKGGVLSNPASDKDKDGSAADGGKNKSVGQVQAHPIVGWRGFEDVVASIPGETVDVTQTAHGGDGAVPLIPSISQGPERTRTTVVFFLGGCTYTEIAALRWVGRQNRGRRFLIATTGIISGGSLVSSLGGTAQTGAPAGGKDAAL
ncbi:Sec1-like protein [Punctularia strigosozonata HHB-11173 SS5]|uniref:Sec1-like protein n=1 Tax=Punctularia strigosozonata (strain HHB-11173) TaxID=741275 RepID=UPI0004416F11|nr:Sec1-like protein [Punctularia strigosozonata HHB-11173 SS5]EIN14426.1 Sec1-like protein [Punctularia strigosozonata HHB-11173 SS5]